MRYLKKVIPLFVKIFMTLLFPAIVFTKSFCQINIINTTANIKPDSAAIIKHIQEPNLLKIIGVNRRHAIQLKASKLDIKSTQDPFTFHVKTRSSGLDTLYVLNAGKVVFKKTFQLINPEPIRAQLGSITDSTATISQILSYPLLRAIIPNCRCFSGHVIGGFRIKFISTHLNPWEKEFDINGCKLNDLRNVIKKLLPKDRISFENIRTVDVDSYPLKLNDVTIIIQ